MTNSSKMINTSRATTVDNVAMYAFEEKPSVDRTAGAFTNRKSPDQLFSYFTASVLKAEIIRPGKSTMKL